MIIRTIIRSPGCLKDARGRAGSAKLARMPERFNELTGFVLAGGASTRMGSPKQWLRLEGETLVERAVGRARAAARTVIVLGPDGCAPGLGLPVLPDEAAGRGPLGAIGTGLRHTRTEYNLFLGCDLPLIDARFLRYLAGRALATRADATLAQARDGRWQPLAAVYRRRARSAVRRSLNSGRNKVTSILAGLRMDLVSWPDLARAGFQPRIFDNLNTPDDYARVRSRLEGA